MGRGRTTGLGALGRVPLAPMGATGATPHFAWHPISRVAPSVQGAGFCTAPSANPAQSAGIPRTCAHTWSWLRTAAPFKFKLRGSSGDGRGMGSGGSSRGVSLSPD